MQKLMIKTGAKYRVATAGEIAEAHGKIQLDLMNRSRPSCSAPENARNFIRPILDGREYEVFAVVFLDNRHRVIQIEEMFRGTIDGCSVHPREVVRAALNHNAAAVIFAHNHPSGVAEASQADELITRRLRDALALVDIRVLDHLIIGMHTTLSFAERGLL